MATVVGSPNTIHRPLAMATPTTADIQRYQPGYTA